MLGRHATLAVGLIGYAGFLVTIVYAIGFVGNFGVPKGIDAGTGGPVGRAVLVNVLLLGLFAVQHTIMARPAFKRRWTRIVPSAVERSLFVLITVALFCLLFWQWRPMTAVVWDVQWPAARYLLITLMMTGWGLVFYSSFLIDHFDLFGVRQTYLHWRGIPYTQRPFVERSLYRWVRHPLMVGFMIAFWSTPTMTQGHLLFAAVTTAYILFGTFIEERTLLAHLGEDYAAYRRRTPKFIPRLWPASPRPARLAGTHDTHPAL